MPQLWRGSKHQNYLDHFFHVESQQILEIQLKDGYADTEYDFQTLLIHSSPYIRTQELGTTHSHLDCYKAIS